MNDKIIFREMLTEIGELAQAKNNKLTVDEIKNYFSKVSLSDEQLELVYSYLEANKIEVQGHEQNDNMKLFEVKEEEETTEAIDEVNENEEANGEEQNLDPEENQYLIMYLEELGTLPKINENEKLDLYNQAIKGDSVAKNKIIEIYLMEVVEIAKGYVDKGILISDLIQEGNIGLMLSVEGLEGLENAAHVEEKIRTGVIASIESVIEENDFINITKKQIVSKVNFLNEGVKNLEEELGRAVSIEELANYMEMSVEEVRDVIRVSDDEIKVKENEEKSNNR